MAIDSILWENSYIVWFFARKGTLSYKVIIAHECLYLENKHQNIMKIIIYIIYIWSCFDEIWEKWNSFHWKWYFSRCNVRKRTFWRARNEDRSACASAQSDQRLRCPREETSNPWLSKMHPVKILIRLCECSGWSESSLGAHVHRYLAANFFQSRHGISKDWTSQNLFTSFENVRRTRWLSYFLGIFTYFRIWRKNI